MKTTFFKAAFLGAGLILVGAQGSHGALLAGWNFNTDTTVSHGSGTLDLSTLANTADATISSGGGTSQNAVSPDSGLNALIITTGSGGRENGKSIIFSLSVSGYQNLILTYATVRTSTGFTDQNWLYSNDGTTFTSFSTINGSSIPTPSGSITSSSYAVETVNFSSITALNNDSLIYIELTLSGGTGVSDRFDNIQFNADLSPVPEPITLALPIFGGLVLTTGLVRHFVSRRAECVA